MAKEISIINILTYRLPYELANQIYNEFHIRLKDATFLIENYQSYSLLKENRKAVELFLSLSIFYRRVIANLDGAVKFYGTVSRISEASVIRIGAYNFTGDEKNKLLAVIINYQSLLEKFSIPHSVMEYYETRELLKKLITLKSVLEDGES